MIGGKIRRSFLQSAIEGKTGRTFFQFQYPHSFQGVNNAFNKRPQNDQYPG